MYSVLSIIPHQGVCVFTNIHYFLFIYVYCLYAKFYSVSLHVICVYTYLFVFCLHNFVVIIVCRVFVYSITSGEVTCTLDLPKTRCIRFSPRSSYLATWEPYAITKDTLQGHCNLKVWSGTELVMEYIQKKQDGW